MAVLSWLCTLRMGQGLTKQALPDGVTVKADED
jgi:hypothetical protein